MTKKTNKELKVEKPKVEKPEAKEPKVEKPEVEKPKVEENKDKKDEKVTHKIDGRRIGTTRIESITEVEFDGIDYLDVRTLDGCITRLNQDDFNKQVKK